MVALRIFAFLLLIAGIIGAFYATEPIHYAMCAVAWMLALIASLCAEAEKHDICD